MNSVRLLLWSESVGETYQRATLEFYDSLLPYLDVVSIFRESVATYRGRFALA